MDGFLIADSEQQFKITASFMKDFFKELSTHYIFPKIKNIHTFMAGTIIGSGGGEKLKVELHITWSDKCTNDDKEFFIGRIHVLSDSLRDVYYHNENLYITNIVTNNLPDDEIRDGMVPNFYKELLREYKITNILD